MSAEPWYLDDTGRAMLRVIAERPRRLQEVLDELGLDGAEREKAIMASGLLGANDYLARNSIAADANGDPFNALAITEKGRRALIEYEYQPETMFEGQPLFFRRRYVGMGGLVEPGDVLWIYGYSFRLTGEDAYAARDSWERRRAFYGWHASVKEPRGEPGFVALADVQEITRDEYEQAAVRGWAAPDDNWIQRFPDRG